jgi:riboflavin biosynthesis pyrimidine reductase
MSPRIRPIVSPFTEISSPQPASQSGQVRNAVRVMSPSFPMGAIIASMRRLLPHPAATVTVREAYDVPRPRPVDRPWVGLCMVASIDGSTVVDQRSAALSNPVDTEVLHTLRDLADLIIVGAATVRIEGYGPPRKPGQQVGVVSRTGDLDLTTPLFESGAGFLILPESAPYRDVPTIRSGWEELDLAGALAQLDADYVQAEGGSILNAALAEADLLDEIDLTISPQVAGGDGARVTAGAPPIGRRMELAHLLEDDGFLFTRYVRRGTTATS